MGLFYYQPGAASPEWLPTIPIPRLSSEQNSTGSQNEVGDSMQGIDWMFQALCQFWQIMHEVAVAYYGNSLTKISERVPLSFAEYKFRELLAWANGLPIQLARSVDNPHYVVVFQ